MLKALELVGFKSFADRTRFDFPEGITVVVGPNGSGKSNVVDAVKWVLGSQSAKALRGADMSDVIFKGSAEGGRKPANSAEVVLILDNRKRILALEADEVQVSRRVYRSGEGEYAINGQPCRLKDVRDLFRGTGVGVDAYSLIEQGKVDRLLQSSARDRRSLFEEAAGISRFKAKKAEAERRLARVDQNMLRIRDIVEELSKRLSTLKTQASKAQRYREWTAEVHRKRLQLGLLDLRELDAQEPIVQSRRDAAAGERDQLLEQLDLTDSLSVESQRQLSGLQQQLSETVGQLSQRQQSLVEANSRLGVNQQRCHDWIGERDTLRERIELLQRRVTVGTEEIQLRERELAVLEEQCQASQGMIVWIETNVQDWETRVEQAQEKLAACRAEQGAHRQALVQVQLDTASHTKELDRIAETLNRLEQEVESRVRQVEVWRREQRQAEADWEAAKEEFRAAEAEKVQAKLAEQEIADRQRQQHRRILEIESGIQGVQERLSLLAQLEEQFANAGRGGQQLIRSVHGIVDSNDSLASGLQSVRGMVADLITTELHLAPLVDVALGTHADAIVLRDGQLVEWIQQGRLVPEGRVTLLRTDRLPTRRTGEKIQLDGLRGVLGRADRLVQFDGEDEALVRSLLGTTWFVESLATALDLSHFRGAGLRFVTAECQLIESDGSITIGSLQSGLGLVSRRSEMQAASENREALTASLEQANGELSEIDEQWTRANQSAHAAEALVVEVARRVASNEHRLHVLNRQIEAEELTIAGRRDEWSGLSTQCEQLQWATAQLHRRSLELQAADTEQAQRAIAAQSVLPEFEARLRIARSLLVDQRVDQARIEQRAAGLRTTLEQMQQDANERKAHVDTARAGWEQLTARIEAAEAATAALQVQILECESAVQQLHRDRDGLTQQVDLEQQQVTERIRQRESLQRQADKATDLIARCEEESVLLIQKRRELIARYRDDYQIELEHPDTELTPSNSEHDEPETHTREALEAQITLLRQEIASAGSVNMEALDELDALETRTHRLASQEQDLLEAKAALVRTMQKIDADSQSLFLETLATIRTNFQHLYRKSFGGGSADILLENPDDPESGIEIIATPPGKTTFSNNLLSGGEKALTAVSLIMAFFQYRPSPFCILDEVDAPFDEANIGRFVNILHEFLNSTKFIVVTHSKKTMTAANMIYGVTMQESGVSRQVAVKFEEVDDRGEILTRPDRSAA